MSPRRRRSSRPRANSASPSSPTRTCILSTRALRDTVSAVPSARASSAASSPARRNCLVRPRFQCVFILMADERTRGRLPRALHTSAGRYPSPQPAPRLRAAGARGQERRHPRAARHRMGRSTRPARHSAPWILVRCLRFETFTRLLVLFTRGAARPRGRWRTARRATLSCPGTRWRR